MLFLTPQCVIQDFQASVLQVSDSTYDEQYVTFFFLVKSVISCVVLSLFTAVGWFCYGRRFYQRMDDL